jgi:hypothetical protein
MNHCRFEPFGDLWKCAVCEFTTRKPSPVPPKKNCVPLPPIAERIASAANAAAQFIAGGCATVSRETAEARAATCGACESFDGTLCRECGCFVAAKIRLPAEQCPLGKWRVHP